MKIIVKNKGSARSFEAPEDCQSWAAISVSSKPETWPDLNQNKLIDWLKLSFDDIDYFIGNNYVLFDETYADKILNFIEKNKHVDILLVHCEAGISRSPAIAAAISKIYLGYKEDQIYFEKYSPNMLVYKILLDVAFNRGIFSFDKSQPEMNSQEQSWENDSSFM